MDNLRKQFIGALLLFCIVMAALFAGMRYLERDRNRGANDYIEEAITTLSDTWALHPAFNYFSQDLVLAVGMDNMPGLMETYSELGKVVEIGSVQTLGDPSAPDELNRIHSNHYVDVQFENGPASIQIELISKDGKFRVNALNIFADRLLSQSKEVEDATDGDGVPGAGELREFDPDR